MVGRLMKTPNGGGPKVVGGLADCWSPLYLVVNYISKLKGTSN